MNARRFVGIIIRNPQALRPILAQAARASRLASRARQRRPSGSNVLRFDFGHDMLRIAASASRPHIIKETVFEKAQPTWDGHWRRVVDGGADLSSAVT